MFNFSGGRIGQAIETFFVGTGPKPGLIPRPAAFAVLAAGTVGGILLAIDRSLPTVLSQLGRGARAVGDSLVAPGDPDAVEPGPAKGATTARATARPMPLPTTPPPATTTPGSRRSAPAAGPPARSR